MCSNQIFLTLAMGQFCPAILVFSSQCIDFKGTRVWVSEGPVTRSSCRIKNECIADWYNFDPKNNHYCKVLSATPHPCVCVCRFYTHSETGKQFTSHLNRAITERRETSFRVRECNPSLLCASTRNLSVKWKMYIQYIKGKNFHFTIFQPKLLENKRNEQCRNITALCASDK